ncbi:putative epoxide hydrolase [Decorospora gaudefroyi]|uniref:Putative epoxide hydrolase n=1 Tax=Decorospora gaudefroyi TaxID=184978 RepID=A0A6A5KH84_9PLEO|nr:putative epoxide hydrolase [Decorospora gaudefroyi]
MALQLFPNTSKSVMLEDGTTYAYISIPASSPSRPTFLLLHGFPSSSFDWRRVIPLLADDGYGVIAPDLLGYGDTDKPTEVAAYSQKRIADHVKELVLKEGIKQVIGVGHDWGSGLLSKVALAHVSLFAGIVFTSVGYVPPGDFDVDQVNARTEQALGYPTFGYWKFFNEDEAGSVIDANQDSFVSLVYPQHAEDWKATMGPLGAAKAMVTSAKVTPLPSWLTEEDVQKHKQIFGKGGLTAPLNWYKSAIRQVDAPYYATFTTEESKCIDVPALVILGEHDYVCVPAFQTQTADAYLRNHRVERLQCGHWIPLEQPAAFSALLKEFAKSSLGA